MHPLSGHTIIFLPGMDGTGVSFEPLGAVLPKDVKVQIVQYPTDRLLGFEETVQHARDQIESDQEDVIVLAESFSGPVAVALIGSGALTVKCLILCSTFATSPRPVLFKILSYLPLAFVMRFPLPIFLLKHVVEGGEASAGVFLVLWRRVKALVPAHVLFHRLRIINRVDVRGLLSRLAIPCLYIQATSDRCVPESALSYFIEAVSDLRVKRIKGPHFILQAQPQASLDAIQNFLRLINRDSTGPAQVRCAEIRQPTGSKGNGDVF